ncbi:MAG: hypothetical protein RR712_03145 [Terrisporobacter sp.]|uniref:hypothetical protein n=1 Tax=Terrisporobacter sp. TaxID=1965305 RepID=UPI002FCB24F5
MKLKHNVSKKTLSLLIVGASIFASSLPSFADSYQQSLSEQKNIEYNFKTGITKSNYENWLAQTQSKETLDEYNSLSEQDKDLLISYLSDINLMSLALTTNVAPNQTKTLANGNIEIGMTEDIEVIPNDNSLDLNDFQSKATQNRRVTYSRYIHIKGVKILQTTSWVTYTHNGKTVTSVNDRNHFTSINLNPVLRTSYSGMTKGGKGSTTAYSTADLSFTYIIEGYGPTLASGRLRVNGTVKNVGSGSYTPYK